MNILQILNLARDKKQPAACLGLLAFVCFFATSAHSQDLQDIEPLPFGSEFPKLDSDAVGEWWKPGQVERGINKGQLQEPRLLVPREHVMAFALYTHDHGILKLSAQLYPLKPDEPRTVTLEFQQGDVWQTAAESPVICPGWSAHFRITDWDNTKSVVYRVRLGNQSSFQGTIRRDPVDTSQIVIASLSCNSSRTPGSRATIVDNLKKMDPDLLFFAGDQSYHHTQHTFGWLEWGVQFRDVLKDRPVVAIPDDHDVGHANLWGASGKKADDPTGPDGGYYYPAEYVKMVERCQTWHLPDPVDPAPVQQGIGVYFTRLRVGGIDCAVLEDRKFKTGPKGTIPQLGPRPDHITDPSYDRAAIDLPNLELLGDRQIRFLNHWAPHLCGDQHLAVVVKHGIDAWGDGPYGFTSPAIVNTIYGRWWHPEDEKSGSNTVPESPLPWTGDYEDGLGNFISMLAYANPTDPSDEQQRSDGFGVARFDKQKRLITFECWPRFAKVSDGDKAQFPGWPITVAMKDNDGRLPVGWLPKVQIAGTPNAVIQVIEEASGEILYTVRSNGTTFEAPVYADGTYTLKAGKDVPDSVTIPGQKPAKQGSQDPIQIDLDPQE